MLEPEELENRRRHVAQGAPGPQRADGGAERHERDRIGGVGGMGSPGNRVDHHLAVAVIGGNQDSGAGAFGRRQNATKTLVDGFDGLDDGTGDAGVTHHVGVGEITEIKPWSRRSNAVTRASAMPGALISGIRS